MVMRLILVLLVPTLAAADAWDETRKERIEPLNSMLHQHWPRLLAERDLDGMLRFYAVERGTGLSWEGARPAAPGAGERTLRWGSVRGDELLRGRYERLLELFPRIERAELRIDRIAWREEGPLGFPLTARLIVRGRGPDGALQSLEQHAKLHVRFYDPFWEITAEEITARTLVRAPSPRFVWRAGEVGLGVPHESRLSPTFRLFGGGEDNPVRQASGVAVADVDGDGCEDLLLLGSPELSLRRSLCDGRYEDATATSGLPSPYPAAASGAAFFDYDNDGRPDLYIAAVTGGDRLFHNEGGGRFRDVTAAAGVPAARWGSMPVVADYDRDGFLDVYVARMGDHAGSTPRPGWDATNGVRGTLLRNLGTGRFEDVSARAGVDSPGWDMAAAWGDYDDDGWPDLYVANEFGRNRLYRNQGDGTFRDRTSRSGTADGGSAMGAAWGDVDGDGDLDLFVSGMHANSGWTLFHPDFPTPIPWYFRALGFFTDAVQARADQITDQLSRGSTLFRNEGDGSFTDVSDSAGVRDGQWGWAGEFLDYDNDGRLDLYAVNGFITGPLLDDT